FVFWQLQDEQLKLDPDREMETTLDLGLQKEIEGIIERHLETLAKQNVTNAAVVVLDAKNGEVLSMVGSADYFDAEHDGAVNAALSPRQPGSALKTFTYALAMSRGGTAATTVADIETQFFTQSGNPYIPRNYDYGYHGLVRYREALANSFNIAAVKVLEKVGVQSLLEFLRSAGIETLTQSPDHYGLALTLGDGEVKLLELAQAYAIFARGGKTLPVRTLKNLQSLPTGVREAAQAGPEGSQILDPRVAWLIADILSDPEARAQEFGTDSPLTFDRPVAAKTGTTRNSRDNWTIGFTPERIVGVWVGNMDNSPMKDTSGITGAGPIFHDAMLASLRGIPPSNFVRPSGIKDVTICRLSGLLPSKYCPQKIQEWFIDGTEPTKEDDLYRQVSIDKRNGLLGDGCPAPHAEPRVFAFFPSELKTWARENGWKQPPTTQSPLCTTSASSSEILKTWITIERPHAGDSFLLDPMIPDESERIIFLANGSDDLDAAEWFVDGKSVGIASAPSFRFELQPSVGTLRVELRAKGVRDERTIHVTK
ncbi:MAG TPA: penicillin-binding transpeptidase domain-containing protein, partial [Candidatus Peribacteraceae bacterium]|nr:penicillin-binding transpeptidase domain-containing protein [Candidatus Peribacteraceae bacterium]